MSAAALDACAAIVRRADPDRYLSALFAPASARPSLLALYALNHELARIGETVREPMLGQIRLEWWREALEGARSGNPRRHEVVEALATVFSRYDLPLALFDDMIEARQFDVTRDAFTQVGQLIAYLDSTSANVMRIAARILGGGESDDALARTSGIAYGLVGTMRALPFHARRAKLYVPDDMLAAAGLSREAIFSRPEAQDFKLMMQEMSSQAVKAHNVARKYERPGAILAAILPAALVPIYLKRIARNPRAIFERGSVAVYRRQIVLLRAALRGHV
jgi:phytoene synthase